MAILSILMDLLFADDALSISIWCPSGRQPNKKMRMWHLICTVEQAQKEATALEEKGKLKDAE